MARTDDPLIVVVGPGAIGCLFASLLIRSGRRVWLLGRDVERAAWINGNGIVVDDDSGGFAVRAMATANPRDISRAEVVLVCVKASDTASARDRLLPCLAAGAAVVSLQNGAGNLETLAERIPADRLVACVTGHGATSLGAGHVRHAGSGVTQVAPFSQRHSISA